MEEKCWIHVDWFFTDRYNYDYWLQSEDGGCNMYYYIEVTRHQFDSIRSFKPKETNNRTYNEALIETLKNILDKYELVEREEINNVGKKI